MTKAARELVNQSIDYILQHLNENLTVKDVSDHFHLSDENYTPWNDLDLNALH